MIIMPRQTKGSLSALTGTAVCRLHLGSDLPLRNSHAMSGWAFRRILGGEGQFVSLDEHVAMLSNDQHRDYLLCQTCEQRIGRWEAYASTMARQDDGSLPALTAVEPAPLLPGMFRASALDVAVMTRFAASVFWRASISAAFPEHVLGSRVEDALRRYLNDEAPFPDDARLTFALIQSDAVPVDQVVAFPAGGRVDGFRQQHVFVLLGLHFVLSFGAQFPADVDTLCFARTGLLVISGGEGLRDRIVQLRQNAEVRGALARRFGSD